MALRTKRADGIDLTDPVEQVSLAHWFALSILILLGSTVWALYMEVYGHRPWKSIQSKFQVAAIEHYSRKVDQANREMAKIEASPEYKAAKEDLAEAQELFKSRADELKALQEEMKKTSEALAKTRKDLGDIRGEYQAAVYQWEQANTRGDEARKDAEHEKIKAREDKVYALLEQMQKQDAKVNSLSQQIFEVGKGRQEAATQLQNFRSEVAKYAGLRDGMETDFGVEIVQYYVPDLDHATDRCASCHIGAVRPGLEDIRKTLESMDEFNTSEEDLDRWEVLFRSHPGDHLMKHPPEKFGCTSCHAGDGLSLSSVWEAHGSHHHHEQPLYVATENSEKPFGSQAETGCNKCHVNEMDIPEAPLLTFGKQSFAEVGCVACHKAKGIWPEADKLDEAKKEMDRVQSSLMVAKGTLKDLKEDEAEIEELYADEKINDEEYDQRMKPVVHMLDLNRQDQIHLADQLELAKSHVLELRKDVKKHGPNLANVKDKLRPDWLKEWLLNPHEFNPETKMPRFFWHLQEDEEGNILTDEDGEPLVKEQIVRQVEGVAAYLWQTASAPTENADREAPSDDETIAKGEELFKYSGCLACHVGAEGDDGEPIDVRPGLEGTDVKKRGYGPKLVRTGEKAKFDWLSRWIYDPKSLAPQTRMPNLRLSKPQSEAIAAYLVTQRQKSPDEDQWSDVPEYLEDEELAKEGYQTIQRYGCYSCHNIPNQPLIGLEGEELAAAKARLPAGHVPGEPMDLRFGRIGVELSKHGSKTLHLFDFGLIEEEVVEAAHGHEDHHPNVTRFDYIAYKAWKPRDFERLRYYRSDVAEEHQRMPSFNLSRKEAHAVATFVTSLVEEPVPSGYVYDPGYPGSSVTQGRNLVSKHNCAACHKIENKGGHIWQVFEDVNNAPPNLWGEGRKIQPDWMFNFLKVPFTLRPWLQVRMPYFHLSDDEAQDLSEYFQALDEQPYPYVWLPDPHLTEDQMGLAKEIVDQQCARCHTVGSTVNPEASAPSLDYTKTRLKPKWVADWIRAPEKIVPGTKMPNLNLPEDTIQAIKQYLRVLNTDYQPAQGPQVLDIDRAGDE